MSTLQDRISDYVGTVSDTTALTDQLTAGVKMFVNAIPPEKLDRYSADVTDSGSGADITGHRIFRAHKSGYPAREIPATLKTMATLTGSIYYATTYSPVYCIEKTKGYVLPGGGSLTGVAFPTVTYSSTSISGFPTEWEHGVVLYVAIQQLIGKANTSLDGLLALSLDSVSAPSAPSAPSFTYTDASYTSASYTNALIDTITSTTIGSFGTAPSYNQPSSTFSVTDATTYIGTEEDGAKAGAELQKQSALLDKFGKDLYNELNTVNVDIENYKATVQKVIDQAKLDQERLIQQSLQQIELNKFNAKNTSDLDVINKSKAVELDIQNKAKSLEKQITEYSASLQRYQEQLTSYQADINKAVSKYANDINKYATSLGTNGQNIKNLQEELNRIMSAI